MEESLPKTKLTKAKPAKPARDRSLTVAAPKRAAASGHTAMAEIHRLTEAVVSGRFRERGDAASFAPAEAAVFGDINRMLDAVTRPLRTAAQSLDQIAHGVIPEFVVDDYPGEFNAIKNGRLKTRSNDWDFEGRWKEMLAGLNQVIDTFADPFETAAVYVKRISRGDLTAELSGQYQGDFAKLQMDINKMARNLQRSMQEIADTAQALAAASRQLSGISEQLAGAAGQTASRAADAVAAAESAGGTVSRLDASSRSVGQVTSVITSISAETGALAGQADREAERAGHAGRGFAAVAGEVQRLAQDIRSVAENIAETVQKMSRVLDQTAGDAMLQKLRDSNAEIVSAAKTISTLAWHSRLLAFNAKIEATHAMQAGLSFSEVARGVKTLSARAGLT